MNRREAINVLLAMGSMASSSTVRAQIPISPKPVPTLGVLSPLPIVSPDKWKESPFWPPLRALGWIEGENMKVERASAEGDVQRLPQLAESLVQKKVDVIFATGNESAIAASRATQTIPVVFWGVNYPVELGLAKSLARPGGNVTGVALFVGAAESAKTLDYLRELLPHARKISYIYEAAQMKRVDGTEWRVPRDYVIEQGKSRNFEIYELPVVNAQDIEAALERIARSRPDALFIAYSQLILRESARMFAFANRNRLPTAFNAGGFGPGGGVLSYGPDIPLLFQRAAAYVDKVLRGTVPADLPIELPRKFDLWVNAKLAKSIGLSVPNSILTRADRVIE